jgi:DNA-binding MarR family transcriptional regulator
MNAIPSATPAEPHDSVAELSHDFRLAVSRLSRRLRQQRANDELTAGQFSALCSVYSTGPLTLSELSEHERVTPPSMNRTVNALVEAQLVQRQNAASDGRKVMLTASEAGGALVQETRERRDAWIAQRVMRLSPEQQHVLAEATAIMKEFTDN